MLRSITSPVWALFTALLVGCGVSTGEPPPQPAFTPLEPDGNRLNYRFTDFNGAAGTLADFRGSVVVLDIWATWCSDCREEIPVLQELYNHYRGRDVVIIGLSVDETSAPVPAFAEQHRLPWRLHWGPRAEVVKSVGPVSEIPTAFILDASGAVARTLIGNHTLDEYVAVIDSLI